MDLWPAIDLRGGKCVRLRQGDYNDETVFGNDPVAMGQRWHAEGADRLHLVDLDGARDGVAGNLDAITRIAAALPIPCQVGGGVRDEASIERLLACGVSRLVIGTKAITEPDWFRLMVRKYPGKLVLGIDARNGRVATEGWLQVSDCSAVDLACRFANEPIAGIVYTDIAKDGMLAGPNFESLSQMIAAVPLPVIASGGVTTVADVQRLAAMRADGCILGRALYESRLTLADAARAAQVGSEIPTQKLSS